MTIKHIYPIADQMIDGKRVTVDLVLEYNGDEVYPQFSLDKGVTIRDWLYEEPAIRALGFPVDGIIEDKGPLELAEVKEDA